MTKKLSYDCEVAPEGFLLRRDSMPMKTPAGLAFVVPQKMLAEQIIEEWRAQSDKPKPETMPFTQLALTAIDIVAKKKNEVAASVAATAADDLLCHRADQPPELVERQQEIWQPWLDWAVKRYGAVLATGKGVMPVAQPEKSLKNLQDAVAVCDAFTLAGLQQATGLTGSVILGLALLEKQATAARIFEAAELETLFQIERWGEDPVTADRLKSIKQELEICQRWLDAALSS